MARKTEDAQYTPSYDTTSSKPFVMRLLHVLAAKEMGNAESLVKLQLQDRKTLYNSSIKSVINRTYTASP